MYSASKIVFSISFGQVHEKYALLQNTKKQERRNKNNSNNNNNNNEPYLICVVFIVYDNFLILCFFQMPLTLTYPYLSHFSIPTFRICFYSFFIWEKWDGGGRFGEGENRGLRHAKHAKRLMDVSFRKYPEEWL